MEIIRRVEEICGRKRITFESGWQVWLMKRREPPFPLEEGAEIDVEAFRKHILLSQYPSALDRAVALLAQRPHSKGEIRTRLENACYDPEVISLVLYKLEKENLVDDTDFALQWVQSRLKKYGTARIRRELRLKGVDPETAEKALTSAAEEEQLEHAAEFAARKLRSFPDPVDRRKAFRSVTAALVRRGYSWETARKAFEAAGGNTEGFTD